MIDPQANHDHPVDYISEEDRRQEPTDGIALCLSGGGYRAMLFHLGALWRLNDLGYLPRLDRVSSVSGGSITAGLLGFVWGELAFDAAGRAAHFQEKVVAPIRNLAGHTIDAKAVLSGVLLPGSINDKLVDAYQRYLFAGGTLQDLPDRPRFVINAANVQSGALWRFSKPYMRDYKVGEVRNPLVTLAQAVAASSAFPPFLSPARLTVDPESYSPPTDETLHREPFLSEVVLTDGGVYDNLGLETAWKGFRTVIASNGGGQLQPDEDPHSDWARHILRVVQLIDNQVRSLRKRQLVDHYLRGTRRGAYFSIRGDIADYPAPDTLDCPFARTLLLAETPTRLKRMEDGLQERLINWGYALGDAGMRTWVDPTLPVPEGFPYPAAGV